MEQFDDRFFPLDFNFYGRGQVQPINDPEVDRIGADSFLIVFKLLGDEVGYCTVVFERRPANGEQESMAIELANILASKFVTRLADAMGEFIELSPPTVYLPEEKTHQRMLSFLNKALKQGISGKHYQYAEKEAGSALGLQIIYTPSQTAQA